MAALDTPVNFHRVIKHSLDDREVFSSAEDLMDYCQSGAWYKGQRVAVNFDDGVTMNYTISSYKGVGQPIIDMPLFDPVWYVNEDLEPSGHYMMVYYYNYNESKDADRSNIGFFDKSGLFTHLNNPFKFMIMDTFPIFDNDENYYYYYFKCKPYNTIVDYTEFLIGRLDTTNKGSLLSGSGLNTGIYGATETGNELKCYLMPSTSSNNINIVKVYVKADNYYYASEVE